MRKNRSAAGRAPEAETVASATECTGLMPALPRDEAQDEAEAALYGIHAAKDGRQSSGEKG